MKNTAFRTTFVIFTMLALQLLTAPANATPDGCLPGIPCRPRPVDPDPPTPPPTTPPSTINSTDSAACDSDIMNQIQARAFMHAERENMIGQMNIRKPSSVLELSCFNKLVGRVAAQDPAQWFSESRYRASHNIDVRGLSRGRIDGVAYSSVPFSVDMGQLRVNTAIENVVLESLKSYLEENFTHSYLGGSSPFRQAKTNMDKIDLSYSCDFQEKIYHFAKCINFAEASKIDKPEDTQLSSFPPDNRTLTFEDMVAQDWRLLTVPACDNQPFGQETIDLAENKDRKYASMDEDKKSADSPIGDPIYLEFFDTDESCESVPAQSTGIELKIVTKNVDQVEGRVISQTEDPYISKVCPIPGCYYDGKSKKCKPSS